MINTFYVNRFGIRTKLLIILFTLLVTFEKLIMNSIKNRAHLDFGLYHKNRNIHVHYQLGNKI